MVKSEALHSKKSSILSTKSITIAMVRNKIRAKKKVEINFLTI
jgi:hypothetical protein